MMCNITSIGQFVRVISGFVCSIVIWKDMSVMFVFDGPFKEFLWLPGEVSQLMKLMDFKQFVSTAVGE